MLRVSANTFEARRKSDSTRLSSHCCFKFLESDSKQFILDILKHNETLENFPGDNNHNKVYGVTTLKLFCKVHAAFSIGMGSIDGEPMFLDKGLGRKSLG